MNRYRVMLVSGKFSYLIYVLADDELNAAFKAGRQVANFPARYPRPIGSEDFRVTDIKYNGRINR